MSLRSLCVLLLGALSGVALGIFPAFQPLSRPPEITFIPRTSGTTPTEDMHQGASQAAREAGFRLYWNAPTREDDVDRQIALVSKALNSSSKGLILTPTNGLALTTKINEFVGRKIPVVIVQTDSPIPSSPLITSVFPDQAVVSALAAKRILNLVGDGGEIGILGLDQSEPETIERWRSFADYMSRVANIRIVAQKRGTSLVPEAEQNAREVLDGHPKLKALFAVSAPATEGAVLAIQRRGQDHSVVLVGCDEYLSLRADLRAGKLDSSIISDNYQMGFLAVRSLLAAIEGHALVKPPYIPVRLLTQDLSLIHI